MRDSVHYIPTGEIWFCASYSKEICIPDDGEAYRDRGLTINFELWAEIFCMPTCFHVRIAKPCLSVRLSVSREKNHPSFVNISPTVVIDASMEKSSRVLATAWKPKNLIFFFKKVRNWILTCILTCAAELKSS